MSVATKKAITGALDQQIFEGEDNPAVLLHDGKRDGYSSYSAHFRKQLTMKFDTSFQRQICPVYLTFLQDADRTYPQTNAADYIAGYLRDMLPDDMAIGDSRNYPVHALDPSWLQSAGTSAPVYGLDSFRPVQEEEIRSRILSWLMGRGIPPEPEPSGYDPFREQVKQLSNPTVRDYLLSEF